MSAFLKSIQAASVNRTACRLKKKKHTALLRPHCVSIAQGSCSLTGPGLVFSFQPRRMQGSRTDRAFLVPLFINWMEKCIFFQCPASLQSRGETRPTGTTPHRCQQRSCTSPAKAGQSPPAWRQHHPTPAGLAPRTYPHPELMRLIVLVLSAWKMYRLNGQDKRT